MPSTLIPTRNQLRLWSGLMLMLFLSTHLLNLGLGVFSYATMEQGRELFIYVWRSLPGTILLLTCSLLHAWLGLAKFWHRPFRSSPLWEQAQVVTGMLIPLLLASHLVGARLSHEVLGLEDNYAWELLAAWSWIGVSLNTLMVVSWSHGCVGIHYWLRLRPWYLAIKPWLFGLAVGIPLWALAGFLSGGREVQRLATTPGWLETMARLHNWPGPEMFPTILGYANLATAVMVSLLALFLVLRALMLRERKSSSPTVAISVTGWDDLQVLPGTSVLEACRLSGIPHAAVCGGRARCSTCRIRIDQGSEYLPPPSAEEQAVLKRIGAPPNIRLACQLHPLEPVKVTQLLPPHVSPGQALRASVYQYGKEQEIAILFTDLRGFTTMTEKRLPYDVVFLMNRYFRAMGAIIEHHDGHLVQVFGDGIMALFGIHDGIKAGCRNALATARDMAAELDRLNTANPADREEPLRMGIGIHAGPVIVGEMGYNKAIILTAVGDAVNTTSRVQEATKAHEVQLIVSRIVGEKADVPLTSFPRQIIEVRGRSKPLEVHLVKRAHDLPSHGDETLPGKFPANTPATASS